MRRIVAAVVCGVLLLPLVATDTFAQIQVGRSYNQQWGSGTAWARINFDANGFLNEHTWPNGRRQGWARVETRGIADVGLLGRNLEILHGSAWVRSNSDRPVGENWKEVTRVYGSLRILRRTIATYENQWNTAVNGSRNFGSGTPTFFSASQWFWVGPVPCKVTARFGGGYSFPIEYNMVLMQARFSGGPRVWGQGSAWVGVDLWLAGAGIGVNLKLLDTSLVGSLLANGWSMRLTGELALIIRPLTARLFINAWLFSGKWDRTIASWTVGEYRYPLLKFSL